MHRSSFHDLPSGAQPRFRRQAVSPHHVARVIREARLATFFWIQSIVRDDGERTLLFDLDLAIQRFNREMSEHPSVVQLTGIYHNLLRRWAEM